MTHEQTPSPSILIVDDNPLIVNVLQSLLKGEQYDVSVSSNGEEALLVLNTKPVDVIICDVMMPRMDGYELHEVVRKKPELSHIPFVFLTALSEKSEVQRGHEAGADDYLVKPFEPQQLLATVRGKIKRSRTLKTLTEERFNSYRRRVVHTLSHEFRTPLVAINTGTELLLEQGESLKPAKIQGLLEAIQRGGQRLERLVTDFMLLQQIEAGLAARLFETRGRPQIMAKLAAYFVHCHAAQAQAEGFNLQCADDQSEVESVVYEPQILDILGRLVNNALKFSAQDKSIEIFVRECDAEAVVEVRDRGLGIDEIKIKEALEAFSQIDREKYEQQGSGLGLNIASQFAKINGGRLELKQREGGGTVAALILPAYDKYK